MELKKDEIEFLKRSASILEPIFNRRVEELKEVLYKTEPEDGAEIRGRAREMDRWRGILRDLKKPKPIKKQDNDI